MQLLKIESAGGNAPEMALLAEVKLKNANVMATELLRLFQVRRRRICGTRSCPLVASRSLHDL
jgi:hypothetical protein